MAAKRKPLWQVLAAQLLLISVPLYGSLPELSSVAAATRELVDESELGIGRDSAPANDDALGLFIACALVAPPERERATTRAVLRTRGPAKTRLRVDDYGRENQPQAALWFACEIAVAQPVFDNRLTKVTLDNGTVVEHAYDADGTRVRTTTTLTSGAAERVDYLVDIVGLSQVVAESNGVSVVTALHVRGDDLFATLRPNAAPAEPGVEPWVARYFHAEGIGSIRALTNEEGAVSDRYEFEAFGALSSHQGSDPNAYLFAGEVLDPNVGFYYLRERWLNSWAGLFAAVDPVSTTIFDPGTLHSYLYAASDPVLRVDPSGLESLPQLSVTQAVQTNLMSNIAKIAFQVSGQARGRLFVGLGRYWQNLATNYLARWLPNATIETAPSAVRVGKNLLDAVVKVKDAGGTLRTLFMEMKYAFPSTEGALLRLISQIQNGVTAARGAEGGRMIVWTLRQLSQKQISRLVTRAGVQEGEVIFIDGLVGAAKWVQQFLGFVVAGL